MQVDGACATLPPGPPGPPTCGGVAGRGTTPAVTTIGYHASHEQHPPSRLLRDVRLAEEAGFDAVSSSDHFVPWSRSQGHSGYAWTWLGAALQATGLSFGVARRETPLTRPRRRAQDDRVLPTAPGSP